MAKPPSGTWSRDPVILDRLPKTLNDSINDCVNIRIHFVLPNADHVPALLQRSLVHQAIASNIPLNLVLPKYRHSGPPFVEAVPMPEVPIDKDDNPPPWEHYIRGARQGSDVLSEALAAPE